MKDIFQESGEIFRNAAYFAINIVNNITKSTHTRRASISHITVPSCIAESFTSTSSITFSGFQLASVLAKDLYNLINFYIHMTFFVEESILFLYNRRILRLATFYPLKKRYSNKQRTNQSVFYFTTRDKV